MKENTGHTGKQQHEGRLARQRRRLNEAKWERFQEKQAKKWGEIVINVPIPEMNDEGIMVQGYYFAFGK